MALTNESLDVAGRNGLLLDLALLVAERRSLSEVFQRFAEGLLQAANFAYASLVVYESDRRFMRTVGSFPASVQPPPGADTFPAADTGITLILNEAEGVEYIPRYAPGVAAGRMATAGLRRAWTIALQADNEVGGLFTVGRVSGERFSPEDLSLLRAATKLLAGAVMEERRVEAAQREAARGRLLNELSILLNAGKPVDTLFERLRELLAGAVQFDYLGLQVAAEEGFMRMVGTTHPGAFAAPGDLMPETLAGAADVLQTGASVTQYRADRIEGEWARAMVAAGFNRFVAAVLLHQDEVLGVLDVGRSENLAFSESEQAFVGTVAMLLAQARANERRLERSQAQVARSALLNELSLLLNAGEPVESWFGRAAELLKQALPFDYIGLSVGDPARGEMRVVGAEPVAFYQAGDRYPLAEVGALPPEARVVEFRPGRTAGKWPEGFQRIGLERVATAIMRDGGQVLGLFTIGRKSAKKFAADDLELIDVVGALLQQAVAQQLRLQDAEAEAQRAHLLNEISVLVNAGQPVDAVFGRIRDASRKALRFDFLALHVMADEGWRLAGMEPAALQIRDSSHRTSEEVGIGKIFGGGEKTVAYRPEDFETATLRALAAGGLKVAVSALLGDAGAPLGVLTFARRGEGRFTPGEMSFVELLATFLGQATANQRRLAEAESDAARHALLNELSILLNAGQPLESLIGRLHGLLAGALAFDDLAVFARVEPGGPFLAIGDQQGRYFDYLPGRILPESAIGVLASLGDPLAEFAPAEASHPLARGLEQIGIGRVATVILRSGNEALGVAGVARRNARPFDERDRHFIELVGTLVAQAVAAQLRLRESREEAERAQTLNDLSFLINSGEPLGELAAALHGLLRKTIEFADLGILAQTEPGGEIRAIGTTSERGRFSIFPPQFRLPVAEIQMLAETAGFVSELRPAKLDHWLSATAAKSGMERLLLVVLRQGPEVVGLMGLARSENRAFSERDRSFLEVVGALLAESIANRLRLRESELEAAEQGFVADVSVIAASTLDGESLVSRLVEPLRRFLPAPYIALGMVDGDTVVYPNPRGEAVRRPVGKYASLADESEQVAFATVPADTNEFETTRRFGVHAVAMTACRAGGQTAGYIITGSRLEGHEFSARDLRLIRLMARICGPAIANVMAMQQLARERATYDLVVTSLNEAVILVDRNLKAILTNPLGARLADAIDPRRELESLEAHLAALPGELREPFAAAAQGEHRQGRAQVSVAGVPVWFDYEFIPVDDPGLSFLLVAADASSDVRNEEERERHREEMQQAARLAALGELIGGVAHELNNPLTAILGFAEMIASSPDAASLAEGVSVIRKEALRARDIVRDLLFIARPGRVERGDVSLAGVIGHVERLRRPVWAQERIEVVIEQQGIEKPVHGNEHQLTQVLLNLITNAEHAVRDNPAPRIAVRASVEPGRALIEVEDNGHGMDPATIERIFEPFFTTKQGSGTGLGLSLSYTIVAAHEGKLEVESRPGAGTLFRVILPTGTPEPEPAPEPAAEEAPVRARVLVVDDEPSLRTICQRLMASLGHQCSVAADSASALALAAGNPFDVVLCDYRLAAETADAVVEGLLKVAPQLVSRTVIATGATTDPGVVALTQKHNLLLVAKPYGVEEIAAIVARYAASAAPAATNPPS